MFYNLLKLLVFPVRKVSFGTNPLLNEHFLKCHTGVSLSINGIDFIDQELKEMIHLFLILNDKVYVTMLELKSDALPRQEWNRLLILELFWVKGIHMLPEDPKPRGGWSKDDVLDILHAAAGT